MTSARGTATTARGTIPEWTLADRLRKARETTGLEQGEFGELIGVSRATVSNYERGLVTQIRRPMLLAWAMGTGVPLEWLTGDASPAPGGDGAAGAPSAGFEPATYRLEGGRSSLPRPFGRAQLAGHAA